MDDLTTIVAKGDNWFVAHCLELGVVSQGRTEVEARNNLKEALALYIKNEAAYGPEDGNQR